MDPAGVGAIIGISVIASIFLGQRVCDYQTKRKMKQASRNEAHRNPLASLKEEKQSILVIKRQWKMKDLKLPPSFILHNLSIRKF
jgi:hypothetical protein